MNPSQDIHPTKNRLLINRAIASRSSIFGDPISSALAAARMVVHAARPLAGAVMRRPVLAGSISVMTALLAGGVPAAGQTTFKGAGTTWNVPANWSTGNLPQPGDDLLFNSASLTSGFTDTLDASYTVQTLSFDIGANSLSINANASGTTGQTLTLNGSSGNDALGNAATLIDLSSTMSGSVNIGVANGVGITTVALGASGYFNVANASAVLNFGTNSVIAGSGASIFYTGAGTLVLSGANTFGGTGSFFAMAAGSGTVDINNASALGDAGNLLLINGGAIDNTSGAAITTSNYAQKWSGDFTFNGSNALNLGTGAVTLAASPTITIKGSGANGTLTVGGAISDGGSGNGLTKAGNGTLILSGASTYTGPTTVLAGTLNVTGSLSGSTAVTIGSTGSTNALLEMASPASGNSTIASLTIAAGSTNSTLALNTSTNNGVGVAGITTLNSPLTVQKINSGNNMQWFPTGITGGAVAGTDSLIFSNAGGARFYITPNAGTYDYTGNVHFLGGGAGYVLQGVSVFAPTASVTLDSGVTVQNNSNNTNFAFDGLNGSGTWDTYNASNATLTMGSANGSGSFSGSITNSNGTTSVVKTGTGTQEFIGTGFAYGGTTTLNNGTLKLTNTTTFPSDITLDGANSVDLQLNAPLATDSWTFSRAVNGGSANAIIEKVGLGTVTLTPGASSTFVGGVTNAITVTAGTLNMAGSFPTAPSVFVAAGANLEGAGVVGGITVANNGLLTGGNGVSGQLSASGLTFSGTASLLVGNITNYSASTAFNITGTDGLVLNGGPNSVVIKITSFPSGTTGIFKLIGYSGVIGGADFGGFSLAPLPSRAVGYLVNNAGEVDLNITQTDFIKWTGAGSLNWDTTTSNWVLNSSGLSTAYIDTPGDSVAFDDSVSASKTIINVPATVHPTNVVFNNSTNNYVLQGAGGIAGTGSVTINGPGMVTISTPNSYTGGTTLNGGTLLINSPTALGGSGGTLTIGGGTIDNITGAAVTIATAPQVWKGSFTFAGSNALNLGSGAVTMTAAPTITVNGSGANGTLTVGGAISDGGAGLGLTKAGNGTLILAGANTFGGAASNFTLNSGTLDINNATALGNAGNTFVINGGRFDNTSGAAITTSNYAQTWAADINFGGTNALNLGTGAVHLSANRTVTVNGSNPLTIGGVISDGGSNLGLTKSGTGTLALGGASTYTGGVTISQGTLIANNAAALGPSSSILTLGDASSGANPIGFQVGTGVTAPVTLAALNTTSNGSAQTITLNAGGALGANNSELTSTLNLNGNSPLTFLATNTGGHSTAQDANLIVNGTGIAAGNTALTLTGTSATLRITWGGSGGTTPNNFTGDVVINGSVITQNTTYSGQTASHQNLGFLNNNVTVSSGATWTLVWGGETVGALNGAGNITMNNQNALNSIGLTIGNTGVNGAYFGAISGGFGVAKVGAGVEQFGGANGYSGATTVNAGTLELLPGGTVANSAMTVNAATLQVDSPSKTLKSVTMNNATGVFTLPAASGVTTTIAGAFTQSTNYSVVPLFSALPTTNAVINLFTAGSLAGSGTGSLNLSAYGATRVTGSLGFSGNTLQLTITSGASNLVWNNGAGTGNWNLNSASDQNFNNGGTNDVFKSFDAVTFDNTVAPGTVMLSGTLVSSAVAVNNTSGTYTFAGSGGITSWGSLTKTGAGTLAITTANSFYGGTNINAGILNVGSSGALGTGGAISFGGGTLQYSAANTADYSARFATTANQAYNVDTNGQSVTWASGLTSSGGSLTKGGNGTLILTGANTYTGATIVNRGTLQLYSGNNLTFAGSSVAINNGSTFQVAGARYNFTGVTFAFDANGGGTFDYAGNGANGGLVFTGGNTFTTNGGAQDKLLASGSQPYNLNGQAATFNVLRGTDPGSDLLVSAVLYNSSIASAVIKSGNGIVTLSAANTYTGGTTVNGGTMVVSGSISGATTVNTGGTLAGSGTTGGVTVNAGGAILPGSAGVLGNLKTGALAFSGGGTFSLQINTASVNGSKVVASGVDTITGGLTLGTTSPALTVSDLGGGLTLAAGDTIPFITYTGTWDGNLFSVGGSPIANGGSFVVGPNIYQLNYNGGAGNNTVLLTVIPEPSTYAALLGGIGMLAGLVRFRRRH